MFFSLHALFLLCIGAHCHCKTFQEQELELSNVYILKIEEGSMGEKYVLSAGESKVCFGEALS